MATFKAEKLIRISSELLEALGASHKETLEVAGHLVDSNLHGVDSHGIIRLPQYIGSIERGEMKTRARPRLIKNGSSTAVIDGRFGFGQVICNFAMRLAIKKAKRTGIASVGIFNCGHVGRLGYYTEMASREHLVGLLFANTNLTVAPWGGRERMLGTNPLSISIPVQKANPVLIDLSTSVVAEGKVRDALVRGKSVPPDWMIDSKGRPSTNPADLYIPPYPPRQVKLGGALLPMGGYKGYALSMAIEIMTGILVGRTVESDLHGGNCVLIIAIDVRRFSPVGDFEERVNQFIHVIKSGALAPSSQEILIPGEPEFRQQKLREEKGIEVDQQTVEELKYYCKKYAVKVEF